MNYFMRLLRTASLPLLVGLLHQPAQAWTKTGHAAIGFVAEAKLKTDNRATWNKLAAILGTANLYDEDVVGWADTVSTAPQISSPVSQVSMLNGSASTVSAAAVAIRWQRPRRTSASRRSPP